jgi:NADP-dependent 3-hydroxy acid dehydrogenase YdfG
MTERLRGRVAVVTGASAGIGAACARALAQQGADMVVTARRGNRLEALVAELRDLGVEAHAVAGDARNEETARLVVGSAVRSFGRIDILVNNAGVGNYKDLVDTTAADYDELMDSNLRSTFLFTRHVVPHMLERREGTVLMISSMAGRYGFAGQAVYCASKFAQVGFAQSLDRELRPGGIKVGVICPGGVKTEFAIGRGRTEEGVAASAMLEPEDVAGAVVLACTQPAGSRIIEIQMRTMAESLA